MKRKEIVDKLDILMPQYKCELNYNNDYELLIAICLSAQTLDKRVNEVTKVLFSKYNLYTLQSADINDIKSIIYKLGNYNKKSKYIIDIAKTLACKYDGKVPKDMDILENINGIGHKTSSVFLSEYYNIPCMPVDTHVYRTSKRLNIINDDDNIKECENKLKKLFNENEWNKIHKQLVLFGRYICKSKKPCCDKCLFNDKCNYKGCGK